MSKKLTKKELATKLVEDIKAKTKGTSLKNKVIISSAPPVTSETSTEVTLFPTSDTTVVSTTKTSKKKKEQKKSEKDLSVKKEEPKKKLVVKKKSAKIEEPKKEVPKDPPKEESERDKMFPKTFEVHGVKFTRVDDLGTDFVQSICDIYDRTLDDDDKEFGGKALLIAFQWTDEMCAPQGKSGRKASEYEQNTGFKPPKAFPHELDMSIIDAILPISAEAITSHSIYTEFPGRIFFQVFKSRTKEGWFDANNCPAEIYLADYSKPDDKVQGSFINIFDE